MEILRTGLIALVATLVLVLVLVLADFSKRLAPTATGLDSITTAVVFTGQYDRIETALRLFDDGRIDRLLISGVNPKAGLSPDTVADQFRFSPSARAALQSGSIRLSPDAADTFQNAAEAACWLASLPDAHGVILVTSPTHMPRASITLERALPPGTPVIRIATEPTSEDEQITQAERGKFIAAWFATLVPAMRRPAPHLTLCADPATL